MGNKWTLIFDADDTLWENQALFNQFEEEWRDLIKQAGADVEKASKTLLNYDIKCYETGKFGNIYYLESMKQVFADMVDNPEMFQLKIEEIHDRIFHAKPQVFPGILETIEYFSDRSNMYILTKGEYTTQKRKIEQSGLLKYFNGYVITRSKEMDTYRRMGKQYGLDPDTTVMIGNSPRSDINPVLKLGWWAVYVKRELLWVLEDEELLNCSKVFTINNVESLKNTIIGIVDA